MTKEEFEEIIKPLYLLNGKDCQFIRTALLGNFDKWSETKQCNIANVVGQSEQLAAIFEKMNRHHITMLEIGDYDKLAKEMLSS